MARKGITYDQVSNAAAAIKARGIEPTITAVRVELGGEGSYSTISQHLAKWRTESADKVEARAMPPEAEDAAMVAITSIWNIAANHAAKEVQAIQQEMDDMKKDHREAMKEATAEIGKLEEAANASAEKLAETAKALRAAEAKIAELEGAKKELEKAYQQLVSQIKQQEGQPSKKAADTKPERPAKPVTESERKPA